MGLFDSSWSALFATWFRIRCLLICTLIGAIVSIGFSGWQTQSSEGDFKTVVAVSGIQGFDWMTSVCNASPYMYLSPFKFTFNFGGKAYNSNPAYCPWPISNTTFRFVVASLYLLFSIALFFETRFSKLFGSPMLFLFSLLWYSAFVIDVQSLTASTQACLQGFGKHTYFDDLKAVTDFTMICNDIEYAITCGIDLLMFFFVFVVWRAWGHCQDRYNSSPLAQQTGADKDIIPPAGFKSGNAV